MPQVRNINVRRGHHGRAALDEKLESTTTRVALSSAEAEAYGMIACSAELLGIQPCASDLGMQLSAAVYADASAALGIVQRRGIEKVRHIRTQCLWLREAQATKRLAFENIDGSRKPSDLFTNDLSSL